MEALETATASLGVTVAGLADEGPGVKKGSRSRGREKLLCYYYRRMLTIWFHG